MVFNQVVEILGVVTGLIYVGLAARSSVLCWPVGIINAIIYFFVFYVSRIYGDMSLQILYLCLSVYGWVYWKKNTEGGKKKIKRLATIEIFYCIMFVIITSVILYFIFIKYTNNALPILDSITTALSLLGQILLTRKFIENWLIWLVANFLYLVVYFNRELYLTMGLYSIFILASIYGFVYWKKKLAEQTLAQHE
jgi:nicotinamide mononucleotide transporter